MGVVYAPPPASDVLLIVLGGLPLDRMAVLPRYPLRISKNCHGLFWRLVLLFVFSGRSTV
jgi:hypothetical protein